MSNKTSENQNQDPKYKMSFELGIKLAGLPIVTFYQNDEDLNFILDSGTDECVIDKNVLNKISYVDTDKQMTLMGIDGNPEIVQVKNITISYKKANYDYDFLVRDLQGAFDNIEECSKLRVHGMLGTGFFTKYNYVLDFQELIAYCKKV